MALGLVLFAVCAAILTPSGRTSHCDQLVPGIPAQGECEHVGTPTVQLTLQCHVGNCENLTNVTWHLFGDWSGALYKYDPSQIGSAAGIIQHSANEAALCVTSSGLLVIPGDELYHAFLTAQPNVKVNCSVYQEDNTLCGQQNFALKVLCKLSFISSS